MGRRLVVCCDGTWNRRDQKNPTNVTKVSDGLASTGADDTPVLSHYVAGVGTRWSERIRGGVFGMGLSRGVTDAYRWLCETYEPGDEIFLFGFSRGAYTARSAAGLVRNCGILAEPTPELLAEAYSIYRSDEPPDGPRAAAFRERYSHPLAPIRFIGVWDTVGSLGIPIGTSRVTRWVNRRWGFHDTDLSRSVQHAYHALAIDESRKPYAPTLWSAPSDAPDDQVVEQVWFSGAHSDVGGGFAESGLSDLALLWMVERAESCGLAFRDEAMTPAATPGAGMRMPIQPDPMGPLHNKPSGLFRLIPQATRASLGRTERGHESIADSAVVRTQRDPEYRPRNLMDALAAQVRQMRLPGRAVT